MVNLVVIINAKYAKASAIKNIDKPKKVDKQSLVAIENINKVIKVNRLINDISKPEKVNKTDVGIVKKTNRKFMLDMLFITLLKLANCLILIICIVIIAIAKLKNIIITKDMLKNIGLILYLFV